MPFSIIDQNPPTLNDSYLVRYCKRTKRSYADLNIDEVKLFNSLGRLRYRRDYKNLYKHLSKISVNPDSDLNLLLDLKYAITEDLPKATFKHYDDNQNLTPEGREIDMASFVHNPILRDNQTSESNRTSFDIEMSKVENLSSTNTSKTHVKIVRITRLIPKLWNLKMYLRNKRKTCLHKTHPKREPLRHPDQ